MAGRKAIICPMSLSNSKKKEKFDRGGGGDAFPLPPKSANRNDRNVSIILKRQ